MLRELGAVLRGLFSASGHPPDFAAGQIWRYTTRPGEERSRLYIVKVDAWPNGERIFHVYADKLSITHPMLAGGVQTVLPHAPVSTETLRLSVTRLQGIAPCPPDISEGYADWRTQYEAGSAGVFSISVADIVTLIEKAVCKLGESHS